MHMLYLSKMTLGRFPSLDSFPHAHLLLRADEESSVLCAALAR